MTREVTAWWAIAGVDLLDALRRVGDGDDPDVVYLELLANAHGDDDDE